MAQLHIKTGDTVVVLSGSSKGVKGEVIATSPKEGKVIVKGANMIKKHVKARRQGDVSGIIDAEGAMYASKVALFCPKCNKGVRTHVVVDGDKKIRTCKCGHKFD
jgi:large subunit ribosomal protein L24